jgi:hypothetical protein
MARIRIVAEWIRSPASPPHRGQVVMVVAEKWAEQRVLMRAYAECRDQLRPTIGLHGNELAISPAGVDPHGPWGIHVEPTTDGHADELRRQLELAARRLAGAKGNPPRLRDEEGSFFVKPTNHWAPGTPRDLPVARAATHLATSSPAPQAMTLAAPSNPELRKTPIPRPPGRARRNRSTTGDGFRTALGHQSGAGAQSALMRLGLHPGVSARLGSLATLTVPADFQISAQERLVLNTLGERSLTAHAIALMLGITDAIGWMEALISRLEAHDIRIIEPGFAVGSEPTYVLRTA